MKLTHSRAVLLMIAVTLMWSIAGAVTRQLESAKSFEVTFWRSFFTVISLLVILPIWQGRGVFKSFHWKSVPFWISGLCWSVMFTAFMVALTLTSVGNVLVTMAVGPLLTALIARIFIGHKLPARTWGAIAVACAGIAYMFGQQLDLKQSGAALGMAVAFCVPVAGAIHWTVVQRAQAKGEQLDFVPCVLIGAVISSLITLPLSFPFAASGSDVGWLALLGLVQLAIPCTLAVICAKVLKAPEVSLLALLEVIFGILWAWMFAGEVPTQAVLIGGTLVIGALVANEALGWKSS
ncbi:DMT family transporter [Variovorax sp. PCZ-1]|uniref:DMT family transporter n=1 Tax=Variovorax sp. PCZ-1 TaxID=2835533 RepID=UPI001BD1A488|nr:DMT family transporter [Variovorax sp. PCZ-1]MBS7807126.1 DMT family transporter [Variovorax sp. PCZ-1]